MVKKNDTFVEIYFNYQEKYEDIYGGKTIVIIEKGSFYEIYEYELNGMIIGKCHEIRSLTEKEFHDKSKHLKITKSNTKLPLSKKNPYMAGFPVKYEKYQEMKNMLLKYNYTIVKIDQIGDNDNGKKNREVTEIITRGTDMSPGDHIYSNCIASLYINFKHNKVSISILNILTGNSNIKKFSVDNLGNINYYDIYKYLLINEFSELIIYIDDYQKQFSQQVELNDDNFYDLIEKHLVKELSINQFNYKLYIEFNKDYLNPTYQRILLQRVFGDNVDITKIFGYISDSSNNNKTDKYDNISYLFLLSYCSDHNENIIYKLSLPDLTWNQNDRLNLEFNACLQLELIDNGKSTGKYNSLLSIIDNTYTKMGHHKLKNNILFPYTDTKIINQYYNLSDELLNDNDLFQIFKDNLKNIKDLNRLHRKLLLAGNARMYKIHPNELSCIINSYKNVLKIIRVSEKNKEFKKLISDNSSNNRNVRGISLMNLKYKKKFESLIRFILSNFNHKYIDNSCKILLNKVRNRFIPINLSQDKIFIKCDDEISEKYNQLYNYYQDFQNIIEELNKYMPSYKKNKIKLDIEYSDDDCKYKLVLTEARFKNGLYTNSKMIDKYVDDPLKSYKYKVKTVYIENNEISELINNISTLKLEIETYQYNKYIELIDQIKLNYYKLFPIINDYVGIIDVIVSNVITTKKYKYYRPTINQCDHSYFSAKNIRHPIVERIINHEYVLNNLSLGSSDPHNKLDKSIGMLLYGTNASGKTTLSKAVSLNIIMAQAGLFVPSRLTLSPYKKILTRLSGNDNIFSGQSSFVIEMLELKNILNNLGNNSLIICDELCRGTEHRSGSSMAIAAIIKFIETQSTFILSTHMHEIVEHPRIKMLYSNNNIESSNNSKLSVNHISVHYDKKLDALIYDRKLKVGHGGSVYGLEVARYLHLDPEFLDLANNIRKVDYTIKPKVISDNLSRNNLIFTDEITNNLFDIKKSKYNSNKLIDACQICGNSSGELHIHHINEQEYADVNGFIGEFHKNVEWNQITLCSKCHTNLHKNNKKIIINQTVDKLIYTIS